MKPNLDNIDQWLFDALEGNLSPVQEQLLEEFIAQHPELELEQEAWIHTNYSASPITFEPKTDLYRKSQFSYKHFVAAATLLLLLSVGFLQFQPSIIKKQSRVKTPSKSDQIASSSNRFTKANTAPLTSPSTNMLLFSDKPSLKLTHPISPSSANLAFDFLNVQTANPSDAATFSIESFSLKALKAMPINGYRTNLCFESLAGIGANLQITNKLRWPALQRLSQFAQKELGLSNNQSYDLLLPGKSNIDANISSVGTLSQLRFQSISVARSGTETSQTIYGQQFCLDGYSRKLRAGIGLQGNYKQYADGAVSDYEFGLIAAPKLMISKRLIIEPAARLRMGARFATAAKLQQLTFIEFENADLRAIQIDSTQEIGRRLFYKDLDLSLAIQTPILFASAQLENTFRHFDYVMGNQLNPSASRAQQLLTISLGTQYASRNEKMRIAPYIQYRSNRLQTQYLAGVQLNINKWQIGVNVANNQQYLAALGYFGKHSAIFIQSCQQQLVTLKQPSYFHQVTFRFYTQASRKARRYIDLSL
jgi:hypothetical protein